MIYFVPLRCALFPFKLTQIYPNTSQDFSKHIDRHEFSILSSLTFGKRCPYSDSQEASVFYKALRTGLNLLSAGGPPVDLIPILKYIPERWAPWKTTCREVKAMQHQLYFGLLDKAEMRLARGEGNGCLMEDVLQRLGELGMSRKAAA